MTMPKAQKLVAGLLKLPLYAAYGVFFLVKTVLGAAALAGDRARLLGRTLPCPSCAAKNDLDGRWKCRACSAVYHGEVFRCQLCASGASFFSCRACGVSIPLRGRA